MNEKTDPKGKAPVVFRYNSKNYVETRQELNGIILKVYDAEDREVYQFDSLMDKISQVAITSFNRPAPPIKPLFCGDTTVELGITSWRPFTLFGFVYKTYE